MTFTDFTLLTTAQKAQTAQSRGVYLACRETPGECILLYQLEGFYVELYFPKKGDFLTRVSPFRSTERLRPYLDQIDLSELLKP